ncbi:MAG: ABC transporter substrate-binding protein [Pseudomonadota bacterium]|nr:ABC transporter substrate-binding protein [Pseudomonadota bacterium]
MRKISLTFGILLILVSHSPTGGGVSGPEKTVADFHDSLTQVLKEKSYESKLSLLLPSVPKLFAVETIARISVGKRAWALLDENEKQSFRMLTKDLIASTYAARFREYKNQRFKIVESRSLPKNRQAVKTQLFSGEAAVSLEYHLQNKDSVWQIYDIVANGVSDLSLKRAAYGKTLSKNGFSGLIENISEEIKKNAQKSL